jgi:hypothetical protein
MMKHPALTERERERERERDTTTMNPAYRNRYARNRKRPESVLLIQGV